VATNRRWTILVVPHGARQSRAVEVSARALKWGVGVGGFVGAALLAVVVLTLTRTIDLTHLDRLERTNQLLAQELDLTRTQISQLKDTLAAVAVRDRQMRLLAGLQPTNADVQLAGIGGPVGQWTERDELLAEGAEGRAALDIRLDLGTLLRRANLLANSFSEAAESLTTHVDRLRRTPSIMPTHGFLSSRFALARIHPIYHEVRAHEGIDIAAPMGTPVLASAAGVVVKVDTQPGYGRMVTLSHGNGIMTRYAHLSKPLVRAGQRVQRGDEIALVGNSGITTAPHLHYEVIVDGKHQDPLKYVFPETIVD
jgi:murein DD-endopeptidase MepM/ murein hydrolase activator NlpD